MKASLLLLLSFPLLAAEQEPPAPPPETTRRAVYVPESVKAELREQIKQEVLEQAKRENWAAPNAVPSWVQRFKLSGDIRGRFERDLFARGNATGGDFPDFNAINANKPFDVKGADPSNERYLNVDQDRTRPRIKARLGVEAEIGHGFSAAFKLGSGESSQPVSISQTLGASGGVFSKYQVWIDRVAVRYQAGPFTAQLGRFENPFFGTVLLWSPEVNFDGLVVQAAAASGALRPFATAGAFPIFTSSFSFPAERPEKFRSRNKWLYAFQLGTDWRPSDSVAVKIGVAFYDFDKVEGRTSSACDTNLSFVSCDTDESRPSFAQKGNTYLALRTPSDVALQLESSGGAPEYQFFGLASRFRELVATVRFDFKAAGLNLAVEGEYVHNAGFKKSRIADEALNNRGPAAEGKKFGAYAGGNDGLFARASVGTPALAKQWDWLAGASYRWLQSDAVIDALNDPDFGLGGTNLKGYSLDATLAVADGVFAVARFLSANQIVGPKYGVDVLQFDLLARF